MTSTINPQLSFAQIEYANKKKLTRKDRFLANMETVVPWDRIVAVIEPYYPKSRGRAALRLVYQECYACTLFNSGTD